MPILDLYKHREKRQNLAHFASLASLAAVDGEINPAEKEILDRFAYKLNITKEEYKEVMKKENKYPIMPYNSLEERLERLYDLFGLIYADHQIDHEEMVMLKRYALGLGFTTDQANKVIEKSVAIFSGRISYEAYKYLLEN